MDIDGEVPAGMNIIPGQPIHRPVTYILNNTVGFGGYTASSVFNKIIIEPCWNTKHIRKPKIKLLLICLNCLVWLIDLN